MTRNKLPKVVLFSGLLSAFVVLAVRAAVTVSAFTGPTSVDQGTSYTYQASPSDPNAIPGDTFQYSFMWGDGTQDSVGPVIAAASIKKIWASVGTFNAQVMIRNLRSGESSGWSNPLVVTVSAPVNNTGPTVTSFTGPTTVFQGVPYAYQASASDPSAVSGDRFEFVFNWGDGGTWTTADTLNGSDTVSVNRIWPVAGTFTAAVKVTNLRTGAYTAAWMHPLTVTVYPPEPPSNQPPATPAAPIGPTLVRRHQLFTYSVVTTDPDGDALTYMINWDDGTWTTTAAAPSGQTVTVTHAWRRARSKPYAVRVIAMDSSRTSPEWSAPLYVKVK